MSIKKRPDGKYRARWREADGRERSRHFDRKADAEQHLARVRVDMARGSYIDPDAGRETVGAYAVRWAEAQAWRASSRERAEHIITSQIVPTFGHLRLQAVRLSDVQSWVGRMAASGLAPSTVESYFRCMAAVMIAARKDRLIHESPCEGVRLPRRDGGASSLVPLTTEQVQALAEAVPPRYRALVITSAGLGLRQGEACGLTVDRVDFLRRTVRVDRQLITPPHGACHFGPPKTESSNRVVPLPATVADALAAHLAAFGSGPDGLVFTSRTGAPIRRSTWQSAFSAAARAVGVDATSHDLRHYAASALIVAGCSVKAVQKVLGHRTAVETLDTYGHLWPGDDDRIRAAIDGVLGPNADQMRTAAGLGG